ncbi:Rho termination factor N-terminal domain-containing protein [Amycolatopsis palatopharyngis]|uniref:Rho termination factor N-terminal domain-containing protein n=1 Tax=Amycolatopsis palatopharyngis TaxID=187982 RepID=UPI0013BEA88A|nr:Rho termination factor N-terminal domain-containing protein [Amycolatopsis palatopharyngis]
MSDRDPTWQDLRDQAEHLGIENCASLTTEQLRAAIDERHRADPPRSSNHDDDQRQ